MGASQFQFGASPNSYIGLRHNGVRGGIAAIDGRGLGCGTATGMTWGQNERGGGGSSTSE
jgi:hypothetical protein